MLAIKFHCYPGCFLLKLKTKKAKIESGKGCNLGTEPACPASGGCAGSYDDGSAPSGCIKD